MILSIILNPFSVASYVFYVIAMLVHSILLLFTHLAFLPVCQLQGKMTDLLCQSATRKASLFFPCDYQKMKILKHVPFSLSRYGSNIKKFLTWFLYNTLFFYCNQRLLSSSSIERGDFWTFEAKSHYISNFSLWRSQYEILTKDWNVILKAWVNTSCVKV
jgi:hypothetical protein